MISVSALVNQLAKQSLKMSVEVDQFTDNECGLQRLFISSARFLTS